MDLNELFAPYPGVTLAPESENNRLLEFYDSIPLEGGSFQIRSVRRPDFFKLLKFQSEHTSVFSIADDAQRIFALASMSFRNGYINGNPVPIGYLGDLRVGFSPSVIRKWRSVYSAMLKNAPQVRELGCSHYFYTVVINSNPKAQAALIRAKKSDFVYEPLSPYWMINVFLKYPMTRKHGGVSCRRAAPGDVPRIIAFLDRESRKRAFGYCFAGGELTRRLKTWDGLQADSFFLAEKAGEILGCFAPWSPSAAKSNVIEKIPAAFQLLRPFMNFPRLGEALKATYLTHLEIRSSLALEERREVFRSLFDSYFAGFRDPKAHMISFCDYPIDRYHETLRSYAKQIIPMTLYSVRHRDNPALTLNPGIGDRVGFEIALV